MTTATNTIAMIDTLDALTPRYDAVLCDVWGVVHNGVRVFSEATAALRRALSRNNNNVSLTAQMLGISRATLYRRMDQLGLSRD